MPHIPVKEETFQLIWRARTPGKTLVVPPLNPDGTRTIYLTQSTLDAVRRRAFRGESIDDTIFRIFTLQRMNGRLN